MPNKQQNITDKCPYLCGKEVPPCFLEKIFEEYSNLLNTVFYCDYDRLITLTPMGFDPYIFKFNRDLSDFPIYYISICLNIIFNKPEEWSEPIRNLIQTIHRNNSKILTYWQENHHFDIDTKIDFQKYHSFFFCDDPDESKEEVLMLYDISYDEYLRTNGYRDIDVELYCATSRFDFKTVEHLLSKDANPSADVFDESSPIERIESESSYLSIGLMNLYKAYYFEKKMIPIDENDFFDCIGMGAHETVYSLLTKCSKNQLDK